MPNAGPPRRVKTDERAPNTMSRGATQVRFRKTATAGDVGSWFSSFTVVDARTFPGFDALRDFDLVRLRARLRNVAYDVAVTAMTDPPGIDSEVEAPTRREEEQT